MVATEERLVDFYIYRIGLFPDFEGSRPSAAILPFVFADIEGFGMRSSDRFEAIIGMDVLSQCDFAISKDRTWTLTFG